MNTENAQAWARLTSYAKSIEEQRDELLGALKDAYPYVREDTLRRRIGALIAKVEGL